MSNIVKCLVSVTIPGTEKEPQSDPRMLSFIAALKEKGIKGINDGLGWCDTILSWGCLNQDWFEFEADVETSYGWCRIAAFAPDEWEFWFEKFHKGELLMRVSYIVEKNGEKSYIDHH